MTDVASLTWTTVAVFPYHTISATVEQRLGEFVVADNDGRTFDYWSATEAICFALGYESDSAIGNLIDGMIVDAVEERFGVALPDSRLCGKVTP